MGLISELVRKNPASVRTGHPVYSFAVLGFNSKEVKELHNYAEYLKKRYSYTGLELLSQEQCNTLCCSEKYTGGILDMNAAHLHPLRFIFGLAKAAILAGTDIF